MSFMRGGSGRGRRFFNRPGLGDRDNEGNSSQRDRSSSRSGDRKYTYTVRERGGRRGGRPGHLRGKDIGLYYRNLNRGKNDCEEIRNRASITLSESREREIQQLLQSIQSKSLSDLSCAKHELLMPSITHSKQNLIPSTTNIKQEFLIPTTSDVKQEIDDIDTNQVPVHTEQEFVPCTTDIKDEFLMPTTSDLKQEIDDIDTSQVPIHTEQEFVPCTTDIKDEFLIPTTSDLKQEIDDMDTIQVPIHIEQDFVPCTTNITEELNIEQQYNNIAESKFKREFLAIISGSIESKLENYLPKMDNFDADLELNEKLSCEYFNKKNNFRYNKMQEIRKKLPSYKMQEQILDLIKNNQVIVVSGETGCGKTTQVGQFILDAALADCRGSTCRVVCTQPRRISAITVAERVADERAEMLGESVGYHIRLERKLPRQHGSITFCTTGVLLKQMESDPALSQISHLILDEIHERDTICDFLITILKQVIKKRSDLKIILMSATLNAAQFSKYYNNCPCINIPGFTYPVEELYLEDVLSLTKFFDFKKDKNQGQNWKKHVKKFKDANEERDVFRDLIDVHARNLKGKYSAQVLDAIQNPNSEILNIDLIASLVDYICTNNPPGAILIFLPGFMDISKLHTTLLRSNKYPSHRYVIFPLHSKMPTVNQKEIFARPREGVRKIIIATNIAETSITIDDVVYVIDSGKIKMTNYNVESDLSTLKAEWVSIANSRQRKGRAGRVQPGICYHLYTRAREMALEDYQQPEMLRTRLEEVILKVKMLQLGEVGPFLERVMNPPDPRAIEAAIKLLQRLNALDDNEKLTPLGFHLGKLPMDPKMGKMILMGAMFSCVDPVFSVAASLAFKDAFQLPLGQEKNVDKKKQELSGGNKSDHLVLAEALRRWKVADNRNNQNQFCWDYFLSGHTLRLLQDMKKQFAEYLHEMKFLNTTNPADSSCNVNSQNLSLVKAVICAGLYPNVAYIKNVKRRKNFTDAKITVTTKEDGIVAIHPGSVNATQTSFESKYLLYHLKLKSTKIFLHDTTMIHPLPLLFFGDNIKLEVDNGVEFITVDNYMKFKCCRSTGQLILRLRKGLDHLLENKISHPGFVNWHGQGDEQKLLRAIAQLITAEDKMQMDEDY